MRGVVLLLAAGEGARLADDAPKAFVQVCGVSMVRRAADVACAADLVDRIVVAVPAGLEDRAAVELDGLARPVTIVAGGPTRQASAAAALAIAGDAEAVAVHDAARALCSPALFDVCLRELDGSDAVVPAVPASDTIKEVAEDVVTLTLDRSRLMATQTPQAFRTDVYRRAHEAAERDGFVATDDAALVERLGIEVRIVPGERRNLKITTADDLVMAEAFLRR